MLVETADQRIDDVDIADRQQVQRAAEDVEVVVLLAQGPDQRVDDRVTLLRRASHGRRAERASRRPRAVASDDATVRRSPATAMGRAVRCSQPRAVTSSTVTTSADDPASSRSGPIVTCCCIAIESR